MNDHTCLCLHRKLKPTCQKAEYIFDTRKKLKEKENKKQYSSTKVVIFSLDIMHVVICWWAIHCPQGAAKKKLYFYKTATYKNCKLLACFAFLPVKTIYFLY